MSRFQIEPSTREQGWWVCTDTENLIVCRFENHRFNETQQFTILEDSKFQPVTASTASLLARITREMGDWLRSNHYTKAMPEL